MIDRYTTQIAYGYDPYDLILGSSKEVWAICDDCGYGRWIRYCDYRDLCYPCSKKLNGWKDKISKKLTGRKHTLETLAKMQGHPFKGVKLPDDHVKNIVDGIKNGKRYKEVSKWIEEHQGKHFCECGCGKVIEIKRQHHYEGIPRYLQNHMPSGENAVCFGRSPWSKGLTKETDKRLMATSESHKRENLSIEERELRSKSASGKNNGNWQGGISSELYCFKFNEKLKQQVRDQYNNCDFFSGLPDYICNIMCNGKVQKLAVHHVDYNKTQGCDGVGWKLVPLSRKNHAKTHGNRIFWERLICYALGYDETYYDYECVDIIKL